VFPLSQYVDGYFSAAPDWVGAVTPNVGLAWQNKSWAVGLKVAQFVPIAKTLHPSADSTDARTSVYGGLKAKIFIEFNK
jgi:hypothetical protein